MENRNRFSHLHFERRLPRMHPRLVVFLAAVGMYALLWWILPAPAFLTLLFFITPILVWTASYSWREALAHIIRYLERLQMN